MGLWLPTWKARSLPDEPGARWRGVFAGLCDAGALSPLVGQARGQARRSYGVASPAQRAAPSTAKTTRRTETPTDGKTPVLRIVHPSDFLGEVEAFGPSFGRRASLRHDHYSAIWSISTELEMSDGSIMVE
jgi:hypothetical protein